jgi:hypothetical protein
MGRGGWRSPLVLLLSSKRIGAADVPGLLAVGSDLEQVEGFPFGQWELALFNLRLTTGEV